VETSAKDKGHPRLHEVTPMPPKRTLVLGANGQLGRALRAVLPDAEFTARADLDIADPAAWSSRRWRDYAVIINAAAYTAVDEAETPDGRRAAWATNVSAVARMAEVATANGITLVHVSSDYVFDGSAEVHREDEPLSPMGVYGQTKAAGDAIVGAVPNHYILRTSWVIGDGRNFVRTMASLAARGVDPTVVDDQVGRLTFADDIARAIHHLLAHDAPPGTYNLSSEGPPTTWADVARSVFAMLGHDARRVAGTSTAAYFAGKDGVAPRPLRSTLDLSRIRSTGFVPAEQDAALAAYLQDAPAARE
jgi:dTDP-4-dehydrorhamnose 3,5-epimerase